MYGLLLGDLRGRTWRNLACCEHTQLTRMHAGNTIFKELAGESGAGDLGTWEGHGGK